VHETKRPRLPTHTGGKDSAATCAIFNNGALTPRTTDRWLRQNGTLPQQHRRMQRRRPGLWRSAPRLLLQRPECSRDSEPNRAGRSPLSRVAHRLTGLCERSNGGCNKSSDQDHPGGQLHSDVPQRFLLVALPIGFSATAGCSLKGKNHQGKYQPRQLSVAAAATIGQHDLVRRSACQSRGDPCRSDQRGAAWPDRLQTTRALSSLGRFPRILDFGHPETHYSI
jgi:hypothetical protein